MLTVTEEAARSLTIGLALKDRPDRRVDGSCDAILDQIIPESPNDSGQRVRWARSAYPNLVTLTPASPDSGLPYGRTRIVRGVEISLVGLSFAHPRPLRSFYFVACLRDANEQPHPLYVSLRWTRMASDGGYVSGVRFVSPARVDPSLLESMSEDFSPMPASSSDGHSLPVAG